MMTALVTGAQRGIGAASAIALAKAGYDIICADVGPCDQTACAVKTAGRQCATHVVDVSQERDVIDLFASIPALDLLVNCAGVIQEKPLLETTAADFDHVISINLRGSFLVGREAARLMQRQGGSGRIIMVASDMAYYGRETYSAYVASKHGVLGLVRSWARELAPGILVNAICPGPIDTAMLNAENMSAEWRQKELQIPLARFGQPEEIAALVVFLAGPGGAYFTGQGIGPNGGSVMP